MTTFVEIMLKYKATVMQSGSAGLGNRNQGKVISHRKGGMGQMPLDLRWQQLG
jgi:hypothetical protein